MKIEHIAIWCSNLEKMKAFYTYYFKMHYSDLYENKDRGFSSYFLSFENGARLELMHETGYTKPSPFQRLGLAHFAISLGSRKRVDYLTELLRKNGHQIISNPRVTGDGYYESVVTDPEGNLIELTE